jgi:hypothetical protein
MDKELFLTIFQRIISRRQFLIRSGQLAVLIGIKNHSESFTPSLQAQATESKEGQDNYGQGSYGQDSYGQGEYPIYLPLISKEIN